MSSVAARLDRAQAERRRCAAGGRGVEPAARINGDRLESHHPQRNIPACHDAIAMPARHNVRRLSSAAPAAAPPPAGKAVAQVVMPPPARAPRPGCLPACVSDDEIGQCLHRRIRHAVMRLTRTPHLGWPRRSRGRHSATVTKASVPAASANGSRIDRRTPGPCDGCHTRRHGHCRRRRCLQQRGGNRRRHRRHPPSSSIQRSMRCATDRQHRRR